MRITSTASTVTTSGAINAGASAVDFIFSSDFTGSAGGMPFTGPGDYSYRFQAPFPDSTLDGIPYVILTGSLRIMVYRGFGNN